MNPRARLWGEIAQPYIDGARMLAGTVRLAVICTTQGKTEPKSNYEQQSIDARFYSINELEYLLGSLRGAGFFVHPFFDENDFISWVLEGRHSPKAGTKLLVICTGSSFPGLGSKSLISAFCRLHGLEVIGPDPHSASLARHKYHWNLILQTLGEVVPASWCYHPIFGWINGAVPPLGRLVILKLLHEGASIGIDEHSIVTVDNTLTDKVALMVQQFSQAIIVQEFISGYEVEVPLLCAPHPCAIMPVGISLNGSQQMEERILTYDVTKADAYGFWDFEAAATKDLAASVRSIAQSCAETLSLRDLVRVDFRIGKAGSPKVIDISTSPYITPHSSFAYLASACGASPLDLPLLLVGLACARIGLLHPNSRHVTTQARFVCR